MSNAYCVAVCKGLLQSADRYATKITVPMAPVNCSDGDGYRQRPLVRPRQRKPCEGEIGDRLQQAADPEAGQ